jgi:hypothetical protein
MKKEVKLINPNFVSKDRQKLIKEAVRKVMSTAELKHTVLRMRQKIPKELYELLEEIYYNEIAGDDLYDRVYDAITYDYIPENEEEE